MENKEWLTIAEAAQAAGISPQAIYKRLKTTLNPYYREHEGRKLLHRDALEALKAPNVDNAKVEPQLTPGLINLTRQTVEILQDQLTQKDRQISALLEELAAKNEQIKALNSGLNQAITTAGQAQYLLGRAIIEPAQDWDKQTPGGTAQDAARDNPETEPIKQDPPQEERAQDKPAPEDPQPKKTIWQKLFRR